MDRGSKEPLAVLYIVCTHVIARPAHEAAVGDREDGRAWLCTAIGRLHALGAAVLSSKPRFEGAAICQCTHVHTNMKSILVLPWHWQSLCSSTIFHQPWQPPTLTAFQFVSTPIWP